MDFGTETWLPYNFRLAWEAGSRTEECEVKHKNGQYVGVFVLRQADVKDTPNPQHKTIRVDEVSAWLAEPTHQR